MSRKNHVVKTNAIPEVDEILELSTAEVELANFGNDEIINDDVINDDDVIVEEIQETKIEDVKVDEKKKSQGIGKRIVQHLKDGKTPKETLELILKEFDSKTTMACVYWYKSKINKGLF